MVMASGTSQRATTMIPSFACCNETTSQRNTAQHNAAPHKSWSKDISASYQYDSQQATPMILREPLLIASVLMPPHALHGIDRRIRLRRLANSNGLHMTHCSPHRSSGIGTNNAVHCSPKTEISGRMRMLC